MGISFRRRFMKSMHIFLFVYLISGISIGQRIDVSKRPLRSEPSHDYDAIHYRVKLHLDERTKTFWGENTITISPYKDDFSKCILDAATFNVTSVKDEQDILLDFEQRPHQLIVNFSKSYQYNDTLSFVVSYLCGNVRPAAKEFGLSTNYPLGLTFVDGTEENPPIIQAISWPTGARHWYPCYDHPHDKATQEMIVTVNSGYKVLSNGSLIGIFEDEVKKTATYHWSLDRPHSTYLSVLAAGPYAIVEDSLGSLPINYWVYEKDVNDALRSFGQTPQIIAFFIEEFGCPYPWPKYDQVTVPGVGGGQECTSATLIGQRMIHDQRAEQDFPSHWLVAHEAAHQWWGDMVTLRDWGHTWINESFGTYYDYVYTRHALGDDEGAVDLLEKKNSYLREAREVYMRPIVFHHWDYPNENFDRHTYPKGAVVIHMMRWILGDMPFRKTVSHFLHKHAFQPADTHDFLTAIKEATGQNLDWFFHQWLYKPGHPEFDVKYSWDSEAKQVVLHIVQEQNTNTDIPIYKTPLVIGIVTPDDKRSEKVWLEEERDIFRFDCDQEPLMIRFDEGNYLLKEWKFEKSVDELLYQLENDDVIGRMWAAAELAEHERVSRAVIGLIRCSKHDAFWAVRRAAVQTIGGFKDKQYIDLLKQVATDKNSKVRTAALEGLGELKDKTLVQFFYKRFENDDSYLAQAETLKSIGKCGNRSSIDFLKNARKQRSPRDIIQRAAERALARLD